MANILRGKGKKEKWLGILGAVALAVIAGFLTTACETNDYDYSAVSEDSRTNLPGVRQLPAFPNGSAPAATRAAAETILAELRSSDLIRYSISDEIFYTLDANVHDQSNFDFTNRDSPSGNTRVSASTSTHETLTGGFRTMMDYRIAMEALTDAIRALYDMRPVDYDAIDSLLEEAHRLREEAFYIVFAEGDINSQSYARKEKAEVTRAMTNDDAAIVPGSIFEYLTTANSHRTITTSGTVSTTYSLKEQKMYALTFTILYGSIKVIFDSSMEMHVASDIPNTMIETIKYSGSLEVYGENNALLIHHRIVDCETYADTLTMVGW